MKKLIFLIVMTSFNVLYSGAQPVASFTASVTEGCSPFSTTIQSNSIGNIVYYQWHLEDYSEPEGANLTSVGVSYLAWQQVISSYDVCLTVTDDQGLTDTHCEVDFITVIPSSFLTDLELTLCEGETITVNGTVYSQSNWYVNETFTNSFGCDSIVHILLTFVDEFQVANEDIVHVPCGQSSGGSISFNAVCGTAPYSYAWEPDMPGVENEATDLVAGNYTVTVTDTNNNTTVGSFDVLEPGPLNLELLSVTNATCMGAGGQINFNINGGLAPFKRVVDGIVLGGYFFNTNFSISFESGTYEVGILDANNCLELFPDLITITAPTEPFEIIALYPSDTTVCFGDSILLEVIAPGAVSYEWSPVNNLACSTCASTKAFVGSTPAPNYKIIVEDANGCVRSDTIGFVNVELCDEVWPGDTDTNKVVNNYDLINIGLAYNSTGPIRPDATLSWHEQPAPDWLEAAPNGSNYKHIDTDGNGLIDDNDTLGIMLNWGEMHNFTGGLEEQFVSNYPPTDGTAIMMPFYVEPDTFFEGQTLALSVILGESGIPAEDVYGIAFSLEYDTTVVVPGSAYLTFDESWIGNINEDMIGIQKAFLSPGRIDVGLTRIDQINVSGFGQMAELYITIEDDILFRTDGNDESRSASDVEVLFNITNVLIVNKAGEILEVNPISTISLIEDIASATLNIATSELVMIYPNPANDQLFIDAKNIKLQAVQLYSINGGLILSADLEGSQGTLATSSLEDGLYLVSILTNEGLVYKRITIIH